MKSLSRRAFLSTAVRSTAVTAAAFMIPSIVDAAIKKEKSAHKSEKKIQLKQNAVVLLQGDSITDYGRRREVTTFNSPEALGYGYASRIASALVLNHAALAPRIYNRGVSGDKVYQLRDRWQTDCYDLQPDVLSILIGVNDFWHAIDGHYDGTPEVYRRDYLALMEQTRNKLPNTQVIICEPYAINGVKAVTDAWYPQFDEIRAAAREVADQYADVFVPFQTVFDQALEVAPASYWTGDGVHANLAGSQLMAQAWLEATGL